MALAPFFDRAYGAVGRHLAVNKESLEAKLQSIVVGIETPSPSDTDAFTAAEIATNIVSRLYPKVTFSGDGEGTGRLEAMARSINPEIEFGGVARHEFWISTITSSNSQAIHASNDGWVSHVGGRCLPSRISNPYAAAAAGALASASLFRRVFLGSTLEPDFSISLLAYDASAGRDMPFPTVHLGDVWFTGVGAVGNAALWCLARHRGLSGTIRLIDPEVVALSNLQRYALATMNDVGRPKTDLGMAALAESKFTVDVSPMALESVANEDSVPRTIAISVDNEEGRRVAQALLPELVVNGWTGELSLGASWHRFGESACLACLYQPTARGLSATEQAAQALGLSPERAAFLWVTRSPLEPPDIASAAASLGVASESLSPWLGRTLGDLYTDAVCGAVPLDVVGLGKFESVPLAHQSVLAGVMMAAELVKRSDPTLIAAGQREALVSYDNVLRPPPAHWAKPRARETSCICGDADYQSVYTDRWKPRTQTTA